MAANLVRQRHNGRKVLDGPAPRRRRAQVDHPRHHRDDEQVHPLEVADDAVEADAEAGRLELLRRRRPLHLDAEEVAADGLEEVIRDPAEEEQEHRRPFDRFPEGSEEGALAESVAEHGVAERGENVEDDGHADEDLPRRQVELVDVVLEPADEEVVGEDEGDGRGDGVVGPDIGQDGHLGRDLDVAPEEPAEELGERSPRGPADQGVEDQLVAAVGVFLPARELVVDGERNAFLEAALVVGGQPDDEAVHL